MAEAGLTPRPLEKDAPRTDVCDREHAVGDPRVRGEPLADRCHGVGPRGEENVSLVERAAEDDGPLPNERVHETRVLIELVLFA
jgi:hypothetical protein